MQILLDGQFFPSSLKLHMYAGSPLAIKPSITLVGRLENKYFNYHINQFT